jgi:DNA-binding response OmpR family regulator
LSPQLASLVAVVISTQAEIAGILCEFLAHDGYQARIEDGTEPLAAVLDRVRPRVVLIDVDHPDGFSAGFIERARGIGAAVVAYSPSRDEREVRSLAAAHNLAAFGCPLRLTRMRAALRAALRAD